MSMDHSRIDIFAVADRIQVLRRGLKAGERRPADTSHDEIVKLMVGGMRRRFGPWGEGLTARPHRLHPARRGGRNG